jgi:hypothetical protein
MPPKPFRRVLWSLWRGFNHALRNERATAHQLRTAKADRDAEELSDWFGDYDAAFNPKK